MRTILGVGTADLISLCSKGALKLNVTVMFAAGKGLLLPNAFDVLECKMFLALRESFGVEEASSLSEYAVTAFAHWYDAQPPAFFLDGRRNVKFECYVDFLSDFGSWCEFNWLDPALEDFVGKLLVQLWIDINIYFAGSVSRNLDCQILNFDSELTRLDLPLEVSSG